MASLRHWRKSRRCWSRIFRWRAVRPTRTSCRTSRCWDSRGRLRSALPLARGSFRVYAACPCPDKESMMAIKLYSWPRSSGTRISWALEELALPYEYVQLDAAKREHRAPEYLAINPHGKVPALADGELSFFESGAILLHLGDKYGIDKGLWPGGNAQPRADALSWTVWSMAELGPYMMQTMYHGMDTPF